MHETQIQEYVAMVQESMNADSIILQRVRELVIELDLASADIAVAHCRVAAEELSKVAESGTVTDEDVVRLRRMFSTLASLGFSPA